MYCLKKNKKTYNIYPLHMLGKYTDVFWKKMAVKSNIRKEVGLLFFSKRRANVVSWRY